MSKDKFSISRRSAIKSMAVLGAGTAAMALPTSIQAKGINFDEEFEVIIVGTGFGGNAAALQCAELGLKALVIEKMPAFGGNSSLNGGGMAVAGLDEQPQQDSANLFKQDLLAAGRGIAMPPICETIASQSAETYHWVVKHGAQFKDGVFHYGGHSVPRIKLGARQTGADINVPLREAAQAKGIEYRSNCKLVNLIKESGRVVGVNVMDKCMWDREGSGVERNIKASKGVIIATGGYGRDVDFRLLQDPTLTADIQSTNQPGASAEGIKAMMRIGGAPRHLSWIQLGPWCSPDEEGYGDSPDYSVYAGYVHGIAVDVNTGKRFMNELADRKERADAIIACEKAGTRNGEPTHPMTFCDSDGHNDPGIGQTRRLRVEKTGMVKRFNTLEEIARFYGMPVEPFVKQVAEYNEYVRQGLKKDPVFGKPLTGIKPIQKAPFFAQRLTNRIHYTMGGIAINEHAEVLSMEDGKAIAGLYAAGEVAAGAAGASRLGGVGTTDPLVMGRVAAKRIANLG